MKALQAEASPDSAQPRVQLRKANRLTGSVGLFALATLVLGVVLGGKPDITDQSELGTFLATNGNRLFVAWLVLTASGLAWLCFIVGIRAGLPDSVGRDVFTFAAVAAQAATWIGTTLATATAPTGAHDVPLSVYTAFGEAGHLAGAAGIAGTGAALCGLAFAMRMGPRVWPRFIVGLTAVAGVLLILAAPIGPLSLPVLALWTAAASVTAFRRSGATVVG